MLVHAYVLLLVVMGDRPRRPAARTFAEFFILKSDTKVSTASLDDLGDDASFTRMKSAFLKSQKGSIVSRTVLNRVADLIAE